ncbi:hypothetical protein MY4038_006045 [Beauveria bassiana]
MFPSAINRKPKPLAEAIESEDNELASMLYPDSARQLYDAIGLRLPQGKNVYLRLPFGHRIGEGPFPGNADEKIRTKTATYMWLQEHCPDYTRPQNTSWWRRELNRLLSHLVGRAAPVPYARHSIRHTLPSGFLLISEAQGKRLDRSWHKHHDDENRRKTLFRGLSRITVSTNAIPQPRIGALRLQDDDTIALNNRPLNLYMHMLENEGVSSGIPRGRMYAESNVIFDVEDGQRQLAACAGMRAVMRHFVDPGTRDGPLYLTLNDLIQSNIFVDEQWNVTSIIDLK